MCHQITRFQCDFCDKHYSAKASAKKHEKKCFYNPEMKACATCRHLEKWEETVGDETVEATEGGLYCRCYDLQLVYWGWSKDEDLNQGLISNCEYYEAKQEN